MPTAHRVASRTSYVSSAARPRPGRPASPSRSPSARRVYRSSAPTRGSSTAASTSAPRSRRRGARARAALRHRRRRSDAALLGGVVGRAADAWIREMLARADACRSWSAERASTCARSSVPCSTSRRSTRSVARALQQRAAHGWRTDELRRWVERSTRRGRTSGRTQLLRAVEIALLTGRRVSELHASAHAPPRWRARYLVVDPGPCSPRGSRHVPTRCYDDGWLDEVRVLIASRPRGRARMERDRLSGDSSTRARRARPATRRWRQ